MSDSSDTLTVLISMLADVMGPDFDPTLEVGLDTSFSDDLELESIELVALAERVQAHYGSDADFVAWLSTLQLDQIIELTVGDVVRFVDGAR
ncbi:MAG: hypothetical protein KTR31_20205 [Myxococcales bacterium]|nr:hypothetical protein [Myxococcales bacterium]